MKFTSKEATILQHYKSIMPKFFVQGMIRLKSSVGDTTPQFIISIEQDNENE